MSTVQKPGKDEVLLFLVLASKQGLERVEKSFSGLFLLASDRPTCPEVRKLKTRTNSDYIAVRVDAGFISSMVDYRSFIVKTVTIM